jgi:hypothetical protein
LHLFRARVVEQPVSVLIEPELHLLVLLAASVERALPRARHLNFSARRDG